MIKPVAVIAIAFSIGGSPVSARPVDQRAEREAVIAELRSCVRAHASAAEAAGVATTDQAAAFFQEQCYGVILNNLARHDTGAVPPGIFRISIQDEWAAVKAARP